MAECMLLGKYLPPSISSHSLAKAITTTTTTTTTTVLYFHLRGNVFVG
jgi:hypothetical protein